MVRSLLKDVLVGESLLTRAAVRLMARPGAIAMLLLVRDEADIIESNINFHRHFGIERFVVTDNGSTDGTRDILAKFERQLPNFIVIDNPAAAFMQCELVNRMIQVAKQKFRPRWIISADADEFWYPVSGHYDTELDGRKNILKCNWHNFLPRPAVEWQKFDVIGDTPWYHGGMSKLFCLAPGLQGMYTGNHSSRSIPRIIASSNNIRVYHYPLRSYEQFERKIVRGYRALVNSPHLSTDVAWHWREAYQAWEEDRLRTIYEELGSRPGAEKDPTMARALESIAPLDADRAEFEMRR
jgi:glycosyltransferase involved in cell wall biosynthesis